MRYFVVAGTPLARASLPSAARQAGKWLTSTCSLPAHKTTGSLWRVANSYAGHSMPRKATSSCLADSRAHYRGALLTNFIPAKADHWRSASSRSVAGRTGRAGRGASARREPSAFNL